MIGMDKTEQEVINEFITLTENIASRKTNVLDFGSVDMTFYRREIHLIKMIGDYPGPFGSEIARRFGVTRAVIHKALLKLEEREIVFKEQDEVDKKRYKLFLTEKGKLAHKHHEEYREKSNKALVDYVANLSKSQLKSIGLFLKHANNLIQNHA